MSYCLALAAEAPCSAAAAEQKRSWQYPKTTCLDHFLYSED